MRKTTRYFIPLIASAGAAAAFLLAPLAAADPGDEVSTEPACTSTGGASEYTGTQTTECESPGNVQIDNSPPAIGFYPYGGLGMDLGIVGSGGGFHGGGGHR